MPTSKRLLTRTQVSAILGISHTSVRRHEGKLLFPTQDERGRWLFDEAEVRALELPRRVARTRPAGREAAAVFRMFDEGADLPEIVTRLSVEPATVRALYDEYQLDLANGHERRRAERRRRREREADRLQLKQLELDRQMLDQSEQVCSLSAALDQSRDEARKLSHQLRDVEGRYLALLRRGASSG